jgi:putative methyltransferase
MEYKTYSQLIQKDNSILKDKRFIIQGKSSCLPAYMLLKNLTKKKKSNDKPMQVDVLDACSAPGNKTM